MILSIKDILRDRDLLLREIEVRGWVQTFRNDRFIDLNDGSAIKSLQLVLDPDMEIDLSKISTGASLKACGILVASQGAGQDVELQLKSLTVIGTADAYPIQAKKHSLEFLRTIPHLRGRTRTFGSVMRIRHKLALKVHNYFDQHGFYYLHTPIITGSDCEGAGEMFQITTLPLDNIPKDKSQQPDYTQDFFSKRVGLTVSGQLEAEPYAMALGKVYTFGPTFRAENSNTVRHLAEFWMIEPEMAFCDLFQNMTLVEHFTKAVIGELMESLPDDIDFLDQRYAKEQSQKPKNQRSPMGLIDRLRFVCSTGFARVSYTEAFEILKRSAPNKKKRFEYSIQDWGVDFQSEHERFLVEKHFKAPVIIFDYPEMIKPFYMRENDDQKTVRAMDVLFPVVGEMVGGSQREERLEKLKSRMDRKNVSQKGLQWYLDTRTFGSVPHSGFGLGFDRLVQFVTGMSNIRDVIPFPRTPRGSVL